MSAQPVAAPPGVRDPQAWVTAWTGALDDMELDVERAAAILAATHSGAETPEDWHGTWSPPRDLGPLPAPLAERAQGLLNRQLLIAEEFANALRHNRNQAGAMGRMSASARPASAPVYLDQAL